jgi:crossover junction endodeoxyribonuclease RusA
VSRYDRQFFAGKFVAQEARRDARSGDHSYANSDGATRFQTGAVVDTSTPDGATRKDAQQPEQRVESAGPAPFNAAAEGTRIREDRGGVVPVPQSSAAAPITLPWPPSGNSAVRHAQGVHYLRPEVIAYRDSVAHLCARFAPIAGRYRLHVHLSPPDARKRDADNALKTILDALVKGGYLIDDSLTYMRELLVTTDDERLGHVRVEARIA